MWRSSERVPIKSLGLVVVKGLHGMTTKKWSNSGNSQRYVVAVRERDRRKRVIARCHEKRGQQDYRASHVRGHIVSAEWQTVET